MARLGRRISKMPAMVTRLSEPLIYRYGYVARKRSQALGMTMPQQPSPLVENYHPQASNVTMDPCWSGYCNKGCGRALISATTRFNAPADKYACGICE